MDTVDVLIVGQGIAGTTLAWQAIRRGARVKVVDRGHGPSASRVAAGLMSPVSGKRLALSWRVAEFWDAALTFYRYVERKTGRRLLTVTPSVRLFVDEAQRAEYEARAAGPLRPWIADEALALDAAGFVQDFGGFCAKAARLDVPAYLDTSRDAFDRQRAFAEAEIDAANDLQTRANGVHVGSLGVVARRVVLCRGWAEAVDGGGLELPFEPAKGEVLTLRAPGLAETRVVQRGVWLAPLGGGLFRAGATFDREHIDGRPSAQGREEIVRELRALLKLPFEVVDHRAGVRPILAGRRPIAGFARGARRVGVFNGLGAKGALWAPLAAGWLVQALDGKRPIDPDIDAAERICAT